MNYVKNSLNDYNFVIYVNHISKESTVHAIDCPHVGKNERKSHIYKCYETTICGNAEKTWYYIGTNNLDKAIKFWKEYEKIGYELKECTTEACRLGKGIP